jgi:hypothetical protein
MQRHDQRASGGATISVNRSLTIIGRSHREAPQSQYSQSTCGRTRFRSGAVVEPSNMGCMSKRAVPATRRRGRSAAPRSERRRTTRPFRALKWLLPGVLGVVVFVAGFTLDTAALMRLFWASVTGHFGIVARATALLVVLMCATPGFVKAYRYLARPARVPAPMRKKRQRRAAAQGEKPTEKPPHLAADPGPAREFGQGGASEDSRADASAPSKRGRGSGSAKRSAEHPTPKPTREPIG